MQTQGISIEKAKAERLHKFLLSNSLLSKTCRPKSDSTSVFFPLSRKPDVKEVVQLKKIGAKLAKANFKQEIHKPRSLKEALASKLTKSEQKLLITSFDSLGDVAIMEIPPELEKKARLIGSALLQLNPNLKSVYRIASAHSGEFRTQEVKLIAGKEQSTAHYKEHGCSFTIPFASAFFSPRLSTERLRIAGQVKKNETVAVFFAGVGPFAVVAAKLQPQVREIFAVELNPKAVEYLKKNIAMNSMSHIITPILGDVNKIAESGLKGKCDRIVMPMPKTSEHFLDSAFLALKPEGGIVHYYHFGPIDEPYTDSIKLIKEAAKPYGRKIKIIGKKIVRPFSASVVQTVIDFEAK